MNQEVLAQIDVFEFEGSDEFRVDDCFKVGIVDGISIGHVCPLFKKSFGGKVESWAAADTLKVGVVTLELGTIDAQIISELGGFEETRLCHFRAMLKRQGRGCHGLLALGGKANIFYIRGKSGALLAVWAYWAESSWCIFARYPIFPNYWRKGCRVVSL